MSVVFNVKNKKKFLGYAEVLNVKQALEILPNLAQFSIDENGQGFDVQKFYMLKIPREGCLVLGVKNFSGRGFELGYNHKDKSYEIRILTPSTINDWRLALEYMSKLAAMLETNIVCDIDETVYDSKSILEFDYEKDIMFGLRSIKNEVQVSGEDSVNDGIISPFMINAELMDEILSSANPVEKFSGLMTEGQVL